MRKAILIFAGMVALFVAIGLLLSDTSKPVGERIRAACEREYPNDSVSAAECQITLSARFAEESQKRALDRASAGLGIR